VEISSEREKVIANKKLVTFVSYLYGLGTIKIAP
jgi:hypothetical protein